MYTDYNAELVDTLKVLVSTDCGTTYQTLYKKFGQKLAVTFNLLEKEEIGVQIYNMKGKIMGSHTFPNTRNQTYALDFSTQPAGIYVMRIISPTLNPVRRIIIP